MERLIAGRTEDSWNVMLQLFCREGIASFPVFSLFPLRMLHTDSHAADYADCDSIRIFPLFCADITFHICHLLLTPRPGIHSTGA